MTDIIEPVVPVEQLTAEEIAKNYSAAMDSVRLLEAGKPTDMEEAEWLDTVKRNKEHLQLQLDKSDYYAGYDLKPFEDAVK